MLVYNQQRLVWQSGLRERNRLGIWLCRMNFGIDPLFYPFVANVKPDLPCKGR
jgi:hypothetical protein